MTKSTSRRGEVQITEHSIRQTISNKTQSPNGQGFGPYRPARTWFGRVLIAVEDKRTGALKYFNDFVNECRRGGEAGFWMKPGYLHFSNVSKRHKSRNGEPSRKYVYVDMMISHCSNTNQIHDPRKIMRQWCGLTPVYKSEGDVNDILLLAFNREVDWKWIN